MQRRTTSKGKRRNLFLVYVNKYKETNTQTKITLK
jgi:hypothetical protein